MMHTGPFCIHPTPHIAPGTGSWYDVYRIPPVDLFLHHIPVCKANTVRISDQIMVITWMDY
jgi:hypothetical protein